MSTHAVILTLAGVMFAGVFCRIVAEPLGVSYAGLSLLFGFLASEALTAGGVDLGLRWYHFREIVFFGIIPLLVFNAAIQFDSSLLRRHLLAILVLSIPIGILTGCLVALSVFFGINHASGFPFIVALLLGGILTATDPEQLLDKLDAANRDRRLWALLKGESLCNDVIAVMLFSLLLSVILMQDESVSLLIVSAKLLWVIVGGLGAGFVFAKFIAAIVVKIKSEECSVILLIAAAYALYVLSDQILSASGVLSVFVFSLVLKPVVEKTSTKRIFNMLGELAAMWLFVLVGVSITLAQFSDRWLAISIAIVALLFARGIAAIVFSLLVTLCKLENAALTRREKIGVAVSGSPGAVALALAISIPLATPAWYTVQSAVYGVVAFGIFIQTPLASWLLFEHAKPA
ncbi:MAG: cation:proton antiporter [Pseudomonadota bacterium]